VHVTEAGVSTRGVFAPARANHVSALGTRAALAVSARGIETTFDQDLVVCTRDKLLWHFYLSVVLIDFHPCSQPAICLPNLSSMAETQQYVLVGNKYGHEFKTTMTLDDHCVDDKRIVRLLDTSDDKAVWSDFVAVPFSATALAMCRNLQLCGNGMYMTDIDKPAVVKCLETLCDSVAKGLLPGCPCKDPTSYFEWASQLQVARALGATEVQVKVNNAFQKDPPKHLLLRDGSTMAMSPLVLRMCETLLDLTMDSENMRAIPIPLDDKVALQDIIDFSTDIVLGVDNAYDLWIETLCEWPRERLFGMSNASDFLNNQCALEVCAKAIAKHLTGMKVCEMREFLGIVQESE